MAATYHLPCPVCQGEMWNQQEGKYPWKPGTPVAKCKNAKNGCTGVYWADSRPIATPRPTANAVPDVPGTPQYPAKGPIMQAGASPVDDVKAHFGLIAEVLLNLKALHASPEVQNDPFLLEVVSSTTMEAVAAIAAKVGISRERR